MDDRQALLAAALLTCVTLADASGEGLQARQPSQKPDSNSGAYLYQVYCKACHGDSGAGDGPVGDLLKVRPPDLREIASRSGGSFNRDSVAQIVDGRQPLTGHGGADMPVWGVVLHATERRDERAIRQRIDALVSHVESIQTKR